MIEQLGMKKQPQPTNQAAEVPPPDEYTLDQLKVDAADLLRKASMRLAASQTLGDSIQRAMVYRTAIDCALAIRHQAEAVPPYPDAKSE